MKEKQLDSINISFTFIETIPSCYLEKPLEIDLNIPFNTYFLLRMV